GSAQVACTEAFARCKSFIAARTQSHAPPYLAPCLSWLSRCGRAFSSNARHTSPMQVSPVRRLYLSVTSITPADWESIAGTVIPQLRSRALPEFHRQPLA